MAKLTLTDITSGYASVAAINANNALVETALENTLSRDGTSPNTMSANLDMNGHYILNELAQSGTGFIWKGAWVTATVYVLNNLVSNAGSTYICLVAHTAGAVFATDLAAAKWQLLAQQGLPGAGTGDMLVANNLSELTATKTTARGNISAASSGVNNDITQLTGLTTPLTVAQGGTGAATHTANNVLVGNGTSAISSVAPSTSGNVLTSNGTSWTSASVATESTFTPVLNFGGTTTGITYTTQTGTYSRIGNRVFFDLNIVLSSKGSAVGVATITGLPVAAASRAEALINASGLVMATTDIAQAYITASTITLVYISQTTGGVGSIADTHCSGDETFRISGHYKV